MRPKYRNNDDGFRRGSRFGRNRRRNAGGSSGSFGRSYSKPCDPPSSKVAILMEAGRLAAEYLVAKGVLPATVLLRGSSSPDRRLPEVRGRESASQVPCSDGKTSALARLGNSGSDSGYGRRRFNDDYDRTGSRKNVRGRRKMGHYNDRGHGLDWSRDRGRNRSWNERSSRRYSDSMEDDDDFAPGYSMKDRRGRYDEVGSSVSRVAGEQHSKSEVVGESGSELDDAGSKASSNNTMKEAQAKLDAELNKGSDDVRVSTIESCEVKGARSRESAKRRGNDDMDVKPGGIEEESGNNHGDNLLSLCAFAKVPTRLRSSLANKGKAVGKGPEVEIPSRRDSEMVIDEVSAGEPREGSYTIHIDNSKTEVHAGFSALVTEFNGERIQSQTEAHRSPQCLGSSIMTVDETKKDGFVQNMGQKVESEMETKILLAILPQENESHDLDSQAIKLSSLPVIVAPKDEEMLDVVGELKSVASTSVSKDEAESFVRMGEEKQNQPATFDLNLMDAPEIQDYPVQESCSAPPPEGDDKVIQIIDLEDEATVEANISDSSKLTSEVIYPALENVLNHTAHPDDLTVIPDRYGLSVSDYLSSPSAQAGLNNLQVGMGLNSAEGFGVVEDSIYGSLGDIGFMEDWGQPSHDYEKFF